MLNFKSWFEQEIVKPMDRNTQMRVSKASDMLNQQMSKDPKLAQNLTQTALTTTNPAQKAQLVQTASKTLQGAPVVGNPEGKPKVPDVLSAIKDIQKGIKEKLVDKPTGV